LNTAGILKSSLTSITQPAYEIGREAASELFKLMDKKDFVYVNNHIVLKSTLNIRNSTKSS
jgi:LacI family transcriptional regulator